MIRSIVRSPIGQIATPIVKGLSPAETAAVELTDDDGALLVDDDNSLLTES